jgi:hypothetical protein
MGEKGVIIVLPGPDHEVIRRAVQELELRTKDLFELDKTERDGFAYPCWACVHRDTPIAEAPCRRCDHYAS